MSVSSAGNEGNGFSFEPSISADGRFVAFASAAANLVPDDINGVNDVFVHDRQTGTTERVSVKSGGRSGGGPSLRLSISGDGRFVAFDSLASNLVPGDTNEAGDVFVHDRQTGIFERVSVDSGGTQGNFGGGSPSISAEGRFVAFISGSTNLVSNDTNNAADVFVHDRQTGTTERVSVSSAGTQGNDFSVGLSLSADGRFVAFNSVASNLVPDDTNSQFDVFVHDRQSGTTELVSVSSAEAQGTGPSGRPTLSADGRFVAFSSSASNLVPGDVNERVDVFVHDRQTGTTERVSVKSGGRPGNGTSLMPSISADGRFVAFASNASNLVPGDTNETYDVFVHDRQTGTTRRVSVDSAGNQGNDISAFAGSGLSLSADGRFVAFGSFASNLVPEDTNGTGDVFVHDRANQAEVEEEEVEEIGED